MIIDNFHIKRMTIAPDKTKAPLIIDPDAALSLAISRQPLKPIAGNAA
jgi:hypothetical protein